MDRMARTPGSQMCYANSLQRSATTLFYRRVSGKTSPGRAFAAHGTPEQLKQTSQTYNRIVPTATFILPIISDLQLVALIILDSQLMNAPR
jgi:hypothetical protein